MEAGPIQHPLTLLVLKTNMSSKMLGVTIKRGRTKRKPKMTQAALAELDLANMPGEKIEALNETRRQAITLRTRANDFAAQAAPYVQPKPQPIDDPINLDISSLATA